MNVMPYTRPHAQYVRSAGIMARYNLSKTLFYQLRNHPDPLRRFPHPTLILGDRPLWSEDVLAAWEAAQAREEAARQHRLDEQDAQRQQRIAERQQRAAEKEAARLERVAKREAARQRQIEAGRAEPQQRAAMQETERLRRAAEKASGGGDQ
jgi:hypothetical protein